MERICLKEKTFTLSLHKLSLSTFHLILTDLFVDKFLQEVQLGSRDRVMPYSHNFEEGFLLSLKYDGNYP